MYQFILLIHVFAAVCIIALVLVQQGKGATAGAAFGSGASQTVFGSRGSGSFLFRLTMSFIAVFFITSMVLNYLATQASRQERVITLPSAPVQTQIPATPAAVPPASSSPAVTPVESAPASGAQQIPTRKK